MKIELSLVIPSYNEADNLPILIPLCERLTESCNAEVIIVDNGSTDETQKILKNLIKPTNNIRTIKVDKNVGYGHGILSGLNVAKGEILGWTHGDTQTDPIDALKGLELFKLSQNPDRCFVKGHRKKRNPADVIFTIGMTIIETLLLRKFMWDINAQPTLFHKSFFASWENSPHDYSLDLYAFYKARLNKLEVKRFPVYFGNRAHGTSHWNLSLKHKFKFILRTLRYSLLMKQYVKKK